MKTTRAMAVGVLALVGWMAGGPAGAQESAAAGPRVFASMAVSEAEAASRKAGAIVLLVATAEWCAPCKAMEASAWVDPEVEKFVADHGSAVRFDVDKDAASARAYSIAAMPTIIALREGKEFDRIVGYRDARGLLAWLGGVKKGLTDAQRQARPLDELPLEERLRLARERAMSGRVDEARADYLWLWDNIDTRYPSSRSEKTGSVVVGLEDLTRRDTVTLPLLRARRDAIGEASLSDPVMLREWIGLSRAMGDEAAVLAWFDRAKDGPGFGAVWAQQQEQIEPVLLRALRFADIGRFQNDVPGRLRERRKLMEANVAAYREAGRAAEVIVAEESRWRGEAANLYTALLAAGRDEDAKAAWAAALEIEDRPLMRVMMLLRAVDQEQGRAWQLDLITDDLRGTMDVDEMRQRVREQAAARERAR